jgi:general secretion pathway protein E
MRHSSSIAEVGQEAAASDAAADQAFVAHLLARGLLTPAALERAQRSAAQSQARLVVVLSRLGLMAERDLAGELSAFYKTPLIAAVDFPAAPLFPENINKRFLAMHLLVPLAEKEGRLLVAMADPGDGAAIRAISFFANRPIVPRVAALTDIEAALKRLYDNASTAITPEPVGEGEDGQEDAARLSDLASEAPVIRLVHGLIAQAVEIGASDIHIEPFENEVRIRFRIDGSLREQETQPARLGAALASRIKIMARLNIAERRLPQDGRIRFAVRGKEIDFRVSTSPTLHGESVVLRVLDRGNVTLDFAALGFDDAFLSKFTRLLQRPYGILLVTGPTGSGKTTTLYTALRQLNTVDKKILTIEDPIEYQLEGINQQAVQAQIGRNFAGALRAFLRQDPDIIMVGEIRDTETAKIAVQAALTGHLILATLHTNDAASAATRLLDMGVEDYLLTSTLAGVVSQRLVRRLCPACRASYAVPPSMAEKLVLDAGAPPRFTQAYRAVGCAACHGTGYKGRTTIAELLEMDEPLRRLVLQKASAQEIQTAAVAAGMRTMYQHGLSKVAAGETSMEEVLRATQET